MTIPITHFSSLLIFIAGGIVAVDFLRAVNSSNLVKIILFLLYVLSPYIGAFLCDWRYSETDITVL